MAEFIEPAVDPDATHVYVVAHGRCSNNPCTRTKSVPGNTTVNFYAERGTVLQNKNHPNFTRAGKHDWEADSTDMLSRVQNGEVTPAEVVNPSNPFCDMVLTNHDSIHTFGVHGHDKVSIPKDAGVYLYDVLNQLNNGDKPVVVHVLACREDGPTPPTGRKKTVIGGTRRRKTRKRKTRKRKIRKN